ncbi:MAG: 30S ribosomal protein S12 methylthiotransferase RimO [Planctomycetales bacterium]|nr:30S ribosomal protein S12 methylthiotransferase RimO [Planctomycetales bacterium]
MELPIISSHDPAPQPATNEASPSAAKGTYAFVSLGCPKNLVDSERMLGLLQLDGYRLVHDPDGADFVVVNTCGFIEAARQESCGAIEEMLDLKRAGRTRGVIVSGCLAERQKEALLDDYPEIDHLVGVFGREEVSRVADRLVGRLDEQRTVFRPAPVRALSDRDRLCTFCAIPKMRGKHATKPIEEVVAEAQQLAADGARELIIVAQDTPYYGIDLYGEPRLAQLLEQLEHVDGIDWIRLMYFYPMYVDDRLIDVVAGSCKILPYLDMPLQHASDEMLRRMARRVTRRQTEELLDKLRAKIDRLVMRTTFITGFPGETDAQFEELVEFVEAQRFERAGVFTYSLEPDTPAAALPGHLPEEVKMARRDQLMAVQQDIAFAWAQSQVGRQFDVLLDAPVEDQDDVWIGRTYADAPDVDGLVYVTGQSLAAGQLVRCEAAAAQQYDLIAAPVAAPR